MLGLHTDMVGSDGVDIQQVISFHNIPPQAIAISDQGRLRAGLLDNRYMRLLYGGADVLLNCTMGEGFGVPIVEAQACGTPVIVGNYTAMPELVRAGWTVDAIDKFYSPQGSYYFLPSVEDMVGKLEAAYAQRGNLDLGQQARAGMLADYDADMVTEKYWKPAFEQMEARVLAETAIDEPLTIEGKPRTVSVITPWRDHPELIPLYESAVHEADQVIIIDNASTPENAALILGMVERLGGVYLRNAENMGFSASNNLGLSRAQGDIVVFMNNDIAASRPEWLRMVRRDVQEDMLVGPTKKIRTVGEVGIGYIDGYCLAGLRSTFQELGGWDAENYQGSYYEDNDLCWRAAQRGMTLVERPWGIVHLNGGRTTSSHTPGAYDAIANNRARFEQTILIALGLQSKHRHDWAHIGVYHEGDLLIPCRDPQCVAGLRQQPTGRHVIDPSGFAFADGLVFEDDPQGGVAKIVLHEVKYSYSLPELAEGDVVIDIGAQVGVVSIWLAKKYPSAKIYAYEPVPDSYQRLLKNIAANGITNIIAINRAVTSDRRPLTLTGHMDINSGGMSAFTTPNGGNRYQVESVTLADIFDHHQIERCKLLKLDCEGAEYEILMNAGGVLSRVEHIRGEVHTNARLQSVASPQELIEQARVYVPDTRLGICQIGD
jgi:FkbM family methyltransferase